jgi:hypothetical protein
MLMSRTPADLSRMVRPGRLGREPDARAPSNKLALAHRAQRGAIVPAATCAGILATMARANLGNEMRNRDALIHSAQGNLVAITATLANAKAERAKLLETRPLDSMAVARIGPKIVALEFKLNNERRRIKKWKRLNAS